MASSFTAPWHGLPYGTATCSVTAFNPASLLLVERETLLPGRDITSRRPCLCFLIRHEPSNRLLLFDLSLAEGWQRWLGEAAPEYEKEFQVELNDDLVQQLASEGVQPEEVETIILSHRHFDHTGDVSKFPRASLICGPTEASGTPSLASETSRVTTLVWTTTSHPPIASFDHSHDLLGDGSILIVSAPGHTPGHLGLLVRTGSDEYVLLASDGCHHHLLLSHRPEDAHYALGKVYAKDSQPGDEPTISANYEDYEEASRTLERLREAGRREEVMVVLAHDEVGWARWVEREGRGTGLELKGWKGRGLKGDMVEGL